MKLETRHEIDATGFFNIPGAKFTVSTLKLPEIEFERDKVKYTVTDIRPLNEVAIYIIQTILEIFCSREGVDTIGFERNDGISDERTQLIIDIVLQYGWKAEKKGKNGFCYCGGRLVTGVHWDDKTITFDACKETADAMFEHRKNSEIPDVYINDLIVECVKHSMELLDQEGVDE